MLNKILALFLLVGTLLISGGCFKPLSKHHQDADSDMSLNATCGEFDGQKFRCIATRVNGKNCVFDDKAKKCTIKSVCSGLSATSCEAAPGCAYYKSWRDTTIGYCLSVSEQTSTCSALSKDHCELTNLSKEKCFLVANRCRGASEYDSNGFDSNGDHQNGTRYDDLGFDYLGINRDTGVIYGPDNRDINGRDRRGFDRSARLRDGREYDDYGFNAAGLQADGRDRDARNFDAAGLQPDGRDRDARGFNIARLWRNGSTRDARGFDAQGRLFDGAVRDARGFDAAGNLANGHDRDELGFDAIGQWFGGGNRNDRGFDVNGRLAGGALRDDRGFDARGFLADGRDRDARGFRANRRLANGARRDARGFDADGHHISGRMERPFNDLASEAVAVDANGFTVDGLFYFDLSQHDALGFNANGIHQITGQEWGPLGFNRSGRNAFGFLADHRHINGTFYDEHGFDVNGNHNVTGGPQNAAGFNRDGIHVATAQRYHNGRNIDGRTLSEQREHEVGPRCYIHLALPGGVMDHHGQPDLRGNIQQLPAGYANSDLFVRAIEERCSELVGKVELQAGQTLAQRRAELIDQINLNNLTYQAQRLQTSSYNYIQRDNALPLYVEGLTHGGGNGKFWRTNSVSYLGEAGIDAGGLRRDFRDRVSEQLKPMFNRLAARMKIDEGFNQFARCVAPGEAETLQNCMKNVGQTFGKLSLVDTDAGQVPQGVPYVKLGYNILAEILGKEFEQVVDVLALLRLVDPDALEMQLRWFALNDDQIEDMWLNFDEFGLPEREVNAANFFEYVVKKVKKDFLFPQVNKSFVQGFLSVVPQNLLEDLNMESLALVLEGNPTTVESVEPKIVVSNAGARAAELKRWLIEIIREESARAPDIDFLGSLLRYWTGSSIVPGGAQNLNISVIGHWEIGRLPESHTCFFRMDIPLYLTKDAFKQKIIQAVTETGGFLIQ